VGAVNGASGTVVSRGGLVITPAHIAKDRSFEVEVTTMDGRSHPATILDIALPPMGSFTHRADTGYATWLHVIRGEIEADLDGTRHRLDSDEALAAQGAGEVRLMSGEGGQAVLLSGMPLREPFMQKGPFAMSDADQLAAVIAAHAAGELGTVD